MVLASFDAFVGEDRIFSNFIAEHYHQRPTQAE